MQSIKLQTLTKPVSLKLDAALKARVDALATTKDRTPHWLMQAAIEAYVVREEKQKALREEALAIHEHYMLTGLHISEERADAWLDQLQAGNDIDPPQCQS
jgi:predicted transcriptional regulator